MNKPDDLLRSFGMSGLLITEDLRSIEQTFAIELGHTPKRTAVSAVDYYPQFERSVRIEAEEMAKNYELFYCLEKALRKLITESLEDADGPAWWDGDRVPESVKRGVNDRIKRDIDSGMTRRSDSSIDYTNFGELSVLIVSNWNVFGTIFSSQRAVERVMNNLNLLRGPIAHCCPLSEDEVQRLHLAMKDWFRMIG